MPKWQTFRKLERVESPAATLTAISILAYGTIAGLSLLWLFFRGELGWLYPEPDSWLGKQGWAATAAGNCGLGLFWGLLVVVASQRLLRSFQWARHLERKIRACLRGLTIRQALLMALLSGVAEELLFRGVLMGWLLHHLSPTGALLISSVVFGAAHYGGDRRLLGWTGFSMIMGICLGGLALATESLQAPIAMHVTINGLNLMHEVWERRLFPESDLDADPADPLTTS